MFCVWVRINLFENKICLCEQGYLIGQQDSREENMIGVIKERKYGLVYEMFRGIVPDSLLLDLLFWYETGVYTSEEILAQLLYFTAFQSDYNLIF